jgi:hypothetical protein
LPRKNTEGIGEIEKSELAAIAAGEVSDVPFLAFR